MKSCLVCEKKFIQKTPWHKFCSRKCGDKAKYIPNLTQKNGQIKTCPVCEKQFVSKYGTQIYCSKECRLKNQHPRLVPKICLFCSKTFVPKVYNQKYCSLECSRKNNLKYKGQGLPKRKCSCCGNYFASKTENHLYCSAKCIKLVKKQRTHPEINYSKVYLPKECLICNKVFIPQRFDQKFCSTNCYNKAPKALKVKNYEECKEKKRMGERIRRAVSPEYRKKQDVNQALWRIKNVEHSNAKSRERRKEKYSKGLRSYDLEDTPSWHEVPYQPLKIESDLILLTSDWHIPFDKPEYVDLIYTIAKELNVPDIAIIGDFWDCDNYSQYTQYNVGKTFQDEIKLVAQRLQQIVEFFSHAYFCVGNHEARFLAANAGEWRKGHLKFQQMMNLTGITEGYTTTDNRWMILNNEWRLTHPKNYSQKKLSVARRLADKYHMNIVNTHGHYTAGTPIGHAIMKPDYHIARNQDTYETIGVYRVCDIGGLFEEQELEYRTIVDSTYPRLNPGFAVYNHGEVTVFDFEKYLAEEKT